MVARCSSISVPHAFVVLRLHLRPLPGGAGANVVTRRRLLRDAVSFRRPLRTNVVLENSLFDRSIR